MKVDLSLRVTLDNGGTIEVTVEGFETKLDTDDDALLSRLFEALVERLAYEEGE